VRRRAGSLRCRIDIRHREIARQRAVAAKARWRQVADQRRPELQALQTDFVWGFLFANALHKAQD